MLPLTYQRCAVLLFIVLIIHVGLQQYSDIKAVTFTASSLHPLTISPIGQPVSAKSSDVVLAHDNNWWTVYVEETARVFLPWDGPEYGWCQPTRTKRVNLPMPMAPTGEATKGLQYIKSPKAASSTCAGINIAIALHAARRFGPELESGDYSYHRNHTYSDHLLQCHHYERHAFASSYGHLNRNRNESLLWTFVRNPVARDVSRFYFRNVSIGQWDANDIDYFLEFLTAQQSLQTKYIDAAPESIRFSLKDMVETVYNNPKAAAAYIHEHIFQAYDFIGVTERTTESLAVMTLLWDLDPTSVIVLSAKQAGNFVDMGLENCTKLQKAPKTLHPRVQQHLKSSEYKDHHADFLLYHAANLSLDRTIESLGSERVKERVLLLQQLKELADAQCRDKAIFPCSVDGQRNTATNCYFGDSGCGYRCIDRVMELYRQGLIALVGQ